MHDSIELEKLGVPSIAICTEPFKSGAHAVAKLSGMPDFPFAVVQHPIGTLDESGVRGRAADAVPQVIAALLDQD